MLVRLKQAEKLVLNGPQTKRHRPSRWGCTAHRENKDCNDANQQSISNRLIRYLIGAWRNCWVHLQGQQNTTTQEQRSSLTSTTVLNFQLTVMGPLRRRTAGDLLTSFWLSRRRAVACLSQDQENSRGPLGSHIRGRFSCSAEACSIARPFTDVRRKVLGVSCPQLLPWNSVSVVFQHWCASFTAGLRDLQEHISILV